MKAQKEEELKIKKQLFLNVSFYGPDCFNELLFMSDSSISIVLGPGSSSNHEGDNKRNS